jgi:hypothetical protein
MVKSMAPPAPANATSAQRSASHPVQHIAPRECNQTARMQTIRANATSREHRVVKLIK